MTNCYLGCVNNRKKNYFQLAKDINKKEVYNLNNKHIINIKNNSQIIPSSNNITRQQVSLI